MNGLQIGHFGFFKDPDLTQRLSDDNLFDQIDADGWINVWFGGDKIFLPGFGEFNVYLTCEQTFFWDIVDENGKRTKDGFEEMVIAYNPFLEPHIGDLIPVNPDETFNDNRLTDRLICSNLWFYSNLFRDEYYRYNLIVLNKKTSTGWPDERNAKIIPMNDNLSLEDGDYIVGYRPKPEYMNQLAVVRKIKSGKENSILFRFKVDTEFLEDNPNVIRKIVIFTQKRDKAKILVYPENERDILWDNHNVRFMDEYNRYLLYHGIQEYQPSKEELEVADKLYSDFMKASNYIIEADKNNLDLVARDVDRMTSGEEIKLVGFSRVIIPRFMEWMSENLKTDIPKGVHNILRRVVLTTKYFKGFSKLDEYLGGIVRNFDSLSDKPDIFDGNEKHIDGESMIANGGIEKSEKTTPDINIVMVDGVRQFEDGYIPESAHGYLNPIGDYRYAGDVGNGLYKLMIAGKEVNVFCDMDNGGWMYLIVGGNDLKYIGQFCDTSDIEKTYYYDELRGMGWGKGDGNKISLQFYDMKFGSIKAKISGNYNNPEFGTGYMEIYSGANGQIINFYDSDKSAEHGQNLIVNGNSILIDDKSDLVAYDVEFDTDNQYYNNLLIKMYGDSDTPYCRRYIKMLAVK